MSVNRQRVLEALQVLGIDPSVTEEVLILTDKVVVRRRDILMIEEESSAPNPSEAPPPHIHTDEHTH